MPHLLALGHICISQDSVLNVWENTHVTCAILSTSSSWIHADVTVVLKVMRQTIVQRIVTCISRVHSPVPATAARTWVDRMPSRNVCSLGCTPSSGTAQTGRFLTDLLRGRGSLLPIYVSVARRGFPLCGEKLKYIWEGWLLYWKIRYVIINNIYNQNRLGNLDSVEWKSGIGLLL